MIKIFLSLCASIAVLTPSPLFAADKEVRQLKSKDTADLSSGKAYVLYDTVAGKFDIYFLRSLTPDERVRFDVKRADALAEARAKLRRKRDGAPGVADEELLPDAAFRFADDEINNLIRMDSGRVYEKNGKQRTYVVELPPGEYTIYAAGIDGFTSGTCMCMGTVRFDAEPGKITDLGAILVALEDGKTEIPELGAYEAPEYIRRKALPYIMSVRPAKDGDSVPSLIGDLPVITAEFSAADKIPNFLGMLINRMPPIEGILAYDRDVVIDVRAQLAAEEEAAALAEAEAAAAAEVAANADETAGEEKVSDEAVQQDAGEVTEEPVGVGSEE